MKNLELQSFENQAIIPIILVVASYLLSILVLIF